MARTVDPKLLKRMGLTSGIEMVNIDQIKPHEKNALIYSKEIDEGDERFLMLKESIKQDGLMHNLLVKKVENGYVCISGHRRLSVLKHLVKKEGLAGFSKVPVKITNPSNEQEEEMIMILANLTQRDQTSAERYEEIKRLETLLESDEGNRTSLKTELSNLVGGSFYYTHEILTLEDKLGTAWVDAFKDGLFAPYLIPQLAKLDVEERKYVYGYVSKGNKLTPNVLKKVLLDFDKSQKSDSTNDTGGDPKRNEENKYIGDVLRNLRKNKGLTLKQLSSVIGVNVQSLNNYELNKTPPFANTKKKLADFFGVSVDYLEGKSTAKNIDFNETKTNDVHNDNAREISVSDYDKCIKDARASLKKAFELMEKIDVQKNQLDALEKLIIYMNNIPLEKL